MLLKKLSKNESLKQGEEIGHYLKCLLDDLVESPNFSIHQNYLLGAYAPLKGEFDWFKALGNERALCFPRCGDQGMCFCKCSLDRLEERREFGTLLRVPPLEAPVCGPDIILVPGLGFSIKGDRLGRGGGFYDHYLKSFKGITVGMAFREQIIEKIPVEAHDIGVHFVVSSDGIFNKGLKIF